MAYLAHPTGLTVVYDSRCCTSAARLIQALMSTDNLQALQCEPSLRQMFLRQHPQR